MKYSEISNVKQGIKTLLDAMKYTGDIRISITESDLRSYLEAMETLEEAVKFNHEIVSKNERTALDLMQKIENDTNKAWAKKLHLLKESISLDPRFEGVRENLISLLDEYFDDFDAIKLYQVETLVSSLLKEYELEGVEFTNDDYEAIYDKFTTSNQTLEAVAREYLAGVREVLDIGLEEDLNLPSTVVISASELALDTDDIYQDDDELSDIVGNYLSDEYGFCHLAFNMRVTYNENKEPSDVIVTNIQWDITE